MMAQTKKLNSDDRVVLRPLAEIIFSNPFSTDWAQMERILGKSLKPVKSLGDHHFAAIIPILKERLQQLESIGINNIQDLQGEDRRLLEYLFLFQVYYQFADQFEQLINDQIAKGNEPIEVPFAPEIISHLQNRGLTEHAALRYLALFYQLRRAHYFINHALVGDCQSMKRLRHALWNNIFTRDVRLYADHLWDRMEDFSTLLLGETGTGKGAAAAAMGRSGLIPFNPKTRCFRYSFMETFVAINLSEFPESLIESELFGHRKGAFTGAIDHHKGIFERCSAHGALFMDELGDISVPVQIKLLNVLQDRKFTPVGSREQRRFEGRVIGATNRPLMELRKRGQFRDDLFYRLCSDVIEVPRLQARLAESPDELQLLVTQLVSRMTGELGLELVEPLLTTLKKKVPANYAWPGNVRELEQVIRRIIINGQYEAGISTGASENDWLRQISNGELTAQELLARYCVMLYQRHGTYEEVAVRTALDRRTAKKYVDAGV